MRRFLPLLIFGLLAFTPSVSAAPRDRGAAFKMAVIDMDRVFQEYNKTKIDEAKLKKQAEIYKDYSNQLAESLKKLQEEFRKLRDASQNMALSGAERENRRLNAQDKYAQVVAKEREYRDYSREKQALLREEYDKMREAILKDISSVVNSKCMSEGIQIVVDRSGKSLNNIPMVIYANPALDITERVIVTLNMGISNGKNNPATPKMKGK